MLVTEDRNQPGDPPGDHLVSRPVTKFNGQPNLAVFTGYRVSQATEIYCGQKLLVTEKTNGSFEQQEKRWFTLK